MQPPASWSRSRTPNFTRRYSTSPQDTTQGALPTLYAAVAAKAVAGGYYGPDGIVELKGYPTAVPVPKRALDGSVAKRLWVESELLTRLKVGALSDVA